MQARLLLAGEMRIRSRTAVRVQQRVVAQRMVWEYRGAGEEWYALRHAVVRYQFGNVRRAM